MELAFALGASGAVVAGLAAELRLFAPSRAFRRREAIVWSTSWLLRAVAVAAGIALADGPTSSGGGGDEAPRLGAQGTCASGSSGEQAGIELSRPPKRRHR